MCFHVEVLVRSFPSGLPNYQVALSPQPFPYHAGNDQEFAIAAAERCLLPSFFLPERIFSQVRRLNSLASSLTLSLQGRQTEAHLGLNSTAAGASICMCINRGKNPQQLNYIQRHPAYQRTYANGPGRVRPTFALTFPSPYGIQSEPSSFQSILKGRPR